MLARWDYLDHSRNCAARMNLNADEIYAKVLESGEKWADCKAAFQLLDDMTSTVKSDLITDLKTAHKCGQGEAEARAYAHPVYKDHLAALARARREWLQSEVRYKSLIMLSELRRSEESTRRQEMRL